MSLWTIKELRLLLQAWDEVLPHVGESERSHCARIYDRFTELRGGYTERTEQAIYLQRSVLAYNHQLILDYERESKRSGSNDGWFALSSHERAHTFHANESKSYRFVDLDETMFAAIGRIKNRPPLQSQAPKPQATKLQTKTKKLQAPKKLKVKQQVTKKSVGEKKEDEPRMIMYEWTHDELLSLVHAWRDEVRDYHSHWGSTPAAKVMNTRIYERFTINCNGFTMRTEAAVTTKKRDLALSYHFIANINTQQRQNHQRTWFSMSKIEKLVIFRSVERSSHIADMPEAIFLRIGKIINEERDLGLRDKRRSDEVDDESEEDDDGCKLSPSSRDQAGDQVTSRPGGEKKQRLNSSMKLERLRLKSVSYNAGDVRNAPGPVKKRPQVNYLTDYLAELRQIASAQEIQACRVKEIVREIELMDQTGSSSATLQAKKEGPKFVVRARSVSCVHGLRKGVRESQTLDPGDPWPYKQKAPVHGSIHEALNDPHSTRSLAQETILQLQNQGGMGSAWLE